MTRRGLLRLLGTVGVAAIVPVPPLPKFVAADGCWPPPKWRFSTYDNRNGGPYFAHAERYAEMKARHAAINREIERQMNAPSVFYAAMKR